MHSRTNTNPTPQERDVCTLAHNEDGTALFEGILTLMLFLPIWMFIIYIGTAGIGMTDSYQAARNALWQQQSEGGCGGGVIGTSGAIGTIGGPGSAQYSLQQQEASYGVSGYAATLGFPGSVSRTAVVGCATYPESFPEQPSFQDAVRDL